MVGKGCGKASTLFSIIAKNMSASLLIMAPSINRCSRGKQHLPVQIVSLEFEEPQDCQRRPFVRCALRPLSTPVRAVSSPVHASSSAFLPLSNVSAPPATRGERAEEIAAEDVRGRRA